MATRTKEEERLLDEKIARIQKQNEEILRRRREIEEDKRMAEKQNAVVKLKPASTNVSRERTPALKPSNREIQEDYPTRDFPEHPRSVRTNRGRGAELYHRTSEVSDRTSGPPPDPKSFLYDEERDPVLNERENKPERRNREEPWNPRGGGSDGREFSRSGRRGNLCGRRGGGRGRGGRNEEEDEWRAERKRVDEARIQRQRAADGRWRREWDNEKSEEPLEEPQYEPRRSPSGYQENMHHHHHHHHHSPRHHHYEGEHPSSPEMSPCKPFKPPGVARGRGRGRLNPSELEMDFVHLDCLVNPPSPAGFVQRGLDVASPTSSSQDDLPMGLNRTVQCVGNNFKISIPNSTDTRSQSKPQRQIQGGRGRIRYQRNYSSQSEDDSPQDRGQGVRRQRQQRYQQGKPSQDGNNRSRTTDDSTLTQHKPPLPPFKTERPPSSIDRNDDDGSWEDVTTSGNESMGEDHSSANSSPEKKGMKSTVSMVVNRLDYSVPINEDFGKKEPSCYPFDEYLEKSGSIDSSVYPDIATGSVSSRLKNSDDDTISGITRIESGKTSACVEPNSNEQDSCLTEQENVVKNDCPSVKIEESISNESCTIEQDIVEATIHQTIKNEEVILSDCNKIKIPETHQVEESILESSEKNYNSPSDSTEKIATSGENDEIVELAVEDKKREKKVEDSTSKNDFDLAVKDKKGENKDEDSTSKK